MFQKIKCAFLLPIALLSAFACTTNNSKNNAQTNDIVSVSYSYSVGRAGAERITATSDSVIATAVGGRFVDSPNVSRKINSDEWQKLTSSINLKTLENTENGASRARFDGPETVFEIVTSEKEYRLVNVSESEGATQLNHLKTILKQLVSEK